MPRKFLSYSLVAVFGLVSSASAEVGAIRFKNGPLVISADAPRNVAAKIAEVSSRSAASNHFILQFEQPLSLDQRAKLSAAGVQLLGYLGDNGFFATVNSARLNRPALEAMPCLTRYAEITPDHRLHPLLLTGRIPEWAISVKKPVEGEKGAETANRPAEEPIIALNVVFHADVPLAQKAVNMVQQLSAVVRGQLPSLNLLVIEIPQGMLNILAGMDEIEWIEPPLPAMSELNAENRALTGVNTVNGAPYNLNGAGVKALVYDGGRVFTGHQDFQGRAAVGADELACTGVSDHSTHVAGTIAGGGVVTFNNRGMAPGAEIISYGLNQNGGCSLSQGFLYDNPCDIDSDYNSAINTYGADIANNSIGTNTAPNGFPCTWEGDYSVTDQHIDSIVRGSLGAPFRIVWANGNERNSGRCGTTYHTTAPPACAKNHITCGALNANDDSMTAFSSWGPADDDRMKPDISAPGCQVGGDGGVTSCSSSGGYTVFCGTSMASPTVCGISALLMQDYRARFPARPDFRNSTLKILLAHTAVDRGNPGPDYQFGYGSVRAPAAVDFMRSNDYGNFIEASVDQGGTYGALVLVSASDPVLKITIAWDDPQATVNAIPALVNDLDLVVFDPNNVQRFPWTLGGIANPSANAVQTQKNSVDNIEQVFVNAPTPGVYRIEVRGFNVPQGPQPFSLAASPLLINCSRAGIISLDRSLYPCSTTATVQVVDCDLNTNDNVIETVTVNVASTSEGAGESVVLTETGPQTALFRGTLPMSTTDAPGTLQIAHGDTVTATYIDADNGQGGFNVTVTSIATVDCQPPVISNVQTSNIGARDATVTFTTDESAKGTVRWGTICGSLSNSVSEAGFGASHSIVINGLSPNSTYYFEVDAVDAAGNSATDDNGGTCYTFSTPDIPELFTELFEANDNDLDNKSVTFYPDPGISRYKACATDIVALPTDPAGGTPITTWTGSADDGYASISLSGGATAKLYGVSYGSFFVGTNAYVTFTSGDTTYTETLAAHFTQPRVSGLFNDLNPGAGGQVSWKQLGDRVAVTWLNVYHYSTTNPNTIQIELFFDGKIAISYLVLSDTDGLAGLSAGGSLSPDFFESDLSTETGGCGPQPPTAANTSANVTVNTFKNVTLIASDPNHDPLTYIITSLPTQGTLRDPVAGIDIASTPYTLAGGGDVVRYTPTPTYLGGDSFQFKVNDGGTFPTGGDSNVATVTLTMVSPTASDGAATTNVNTAKNITLVGDDVDHDPLTYIITALPGHGTLRDPVVNATIASVPYALAGGGNVVRYFPTPAYLGSDSFQFKVNIGGAGGDSNVATVALTIASLPPIFFPMDTNPGWTTMGQWAFGVPTGTCGDPSSGFTGANVYGYNLAGCYPNNLTPIQYLTTTRMSCLGLTGVSLRFRRWLGVESSTYDHASIDVSNNGTTWTNVYNHTGATFQESAWSLQTYNISAVADNQPAVYLRWGMGTTDGSVIESGWNIDDIEILASNYVPTCGAILHGDMNVDTQVSGGDVQAFVRTLTNPGSATPQEICAADCYTDGALDMLDVDEFVTLLLNITVP